MTQQRNKEEEETAFIQLLLVALRASLRYGEHVTGRVKLDATHFKAKQTIHAALDGVNPITFTEYAPKPFATLRAMSEYSDSMDDKRWSFPPGSRLTMPTSTGKSGSLFFYSSDKKWLLKTISKGEKNTMVDVLPHYLRYTLTNPRTLLAKFLGLYSYQCGNRKGYIVMMENVLYSTTPKPILELYDLKGRQPKWLTVWHKHATRGQHIGNDNTIKRHFDVDVVDYHLLTTQLRTDTDFLQKHNLMDYSLLIGAIKEDDGAVQSKVNEQELQRYYVVKRYKHSKPHIHHVSSHHPPTSTLRYTTASNWVSTTQPSSRYTATTSNDLLQVELVDTDGITIFNYEKQVEPGREVISRNGEGFKMGIIDYVTSYRCLKRVANAMKRFLWPWQQLSTIPPLPYAARFFNAFSSRFTPSFSTTAVPQQSLKV